MNLGGAVHTNGPKQAINQFRGVNKDLPTIQTPSKKASITNWAPTSFLFYSLEWDWREGDRESTRERERDERQCNISYEKQNGYHSQK